jgi:membrane-anchored protein YejM (alkaline phosphatase superfamily)
MPQNVKRSRALRFFILGTYVLLLANTAAYMKDVPYEGPLQAAFLGMVWLTYTAVYLAPLIIMLGLWNWVLSRWFGGDIRGRWAALCLALPAILGAGTVQMLLFADRLVYQLYGFHFNGFVLNLISTRGGIESMGADDSTDLVVALLVAGFLAIEAVIWWIATKAAVSQRRIAGLIRPRWLFVASLVIVLIGITGQATYAVSSLRAYEPILSSAKTFPCFQETTWRSLGRWLNIEARNVASKSLNYPLAPIRRAPDHPRPNIVWLVSESLRWDMLDPEIMPATWAFSQKASRFLNHHSAGNGTRMGVFGMFYGLYGPYWFPFLDARKGPVLVDLLLEDKYQMELFTSARFTYPEFDKTVWANVPAQHLHEAEGGKGWERDRKNVSEIIDFMDYRDPARPFLTFLFFESPHARYYFPPECVIRKDYLEDFNYATMNLDRDIQRIKNRYINSCRHLDTQIQRLLEYLEANSLLESTIVLITGDHGEEFLEHGRWGHNSEFHEEQIRVPMVLWIPGQTRVEVSRTTSHIDIPATMLRTLGVENPASDFSLGKDLFGPKGHDYVVVAGWDDVACMTDRHIGVFPVSDLSFGVRIERTPTGYKSAAAGPFLEEMQPYILEMMKDLKRFVK